MDLRSIKARIGAARVVLDEQFGTLRHSQVSKIHAAAVCDVIAAVDVSNEDRSSLTDLVLAVK